MKTSTIRKIVIAIITILFMILIPNISKAASFTSGSSYYIDSIYRAMRRYRDAWLDTYPSNSEINSSRWKLDPQGSNFNGYKGSMVWSTGGGCLGHGQQGSSSYGYQLGQGNRG